ncbi:O-antigen ligase family protein [Flavobacterium bizetiae]|uniref:O-antigen ligase family protein n=1 Tax=Flavobacterium bizetiae TaxID=2704140 RepID=UPI0021E8DE88|nr:O-antigen ligase family protein [Flavobacterium bizetiae]UTN05318.1 O-antigen ligase family protein [Flavobacterium bizetiae]
MKTRQIIVPLFLLVVFSQLYLSSFRINIVIQIVVFFILLLLNGFKISVKIINLLTPLFLIFILGFFSGLWRDFEIIYFIKDISHFIKPIIGLMLGYLFFQKIDFKSFIKIIVLTGFSMAFFHILLVLFNGKLSIEKINDLRSAFGKDNFMELFSLLFICFYNRFLDSKIFKNKVFNYIIFFTLLISCLLYFSRTMIVVFFLGVLTIFGYTKINSRNIKILLGFIIAIGVLYIYLFSIKIDRNGKSLESFLYKVKIAPAEMFNTKIDRENHKQLWDHWRGYEAKRALALMDKTPISYIVGTGFGSLIDLKFKAPLDSDGIRYISETHNGYIYIFYKTGILGIFLLLYFLLNLYRYIYSNYIFINVFISITGVCFLFTTLTITGIYNPRDVIIIILGGLFVFSSRQNILLKE